MVIRSVKYGETSLIFDMYTQQYGLASFIVNGARRPKSKLPSSLFQLMNWLELVVYMKDPQALNRVKESQLIFHYNEIPFDLRKRSVALFMTEIVQKTIKENESNPDLFAFLFDSYRFLDQSKHSISNFHILFLLDLSLYLGFRPIGTWSRERPYFHLVSGNFVEMIHPLYTLEQSVSNTISDLLQTNRESIHTLTISKEIRQDVLLSTISFFRYHLERLPEIKTHKILAEVFGS
ncbi:MAG: DNA repair protein RecO [Saprospiraceae bacterium]|nr:DNA repair protein RecO [Saprospiraceae bacterium]